MNQPVTKEQLEFFRALYDEEERTSSQLEGRAKVYLGIVSAFLAALILKATDAKSISDALHVRWGWMLLEAFPMTMALVLVLWSLRTREFEAVNDGPLLLRTYGSEWPTSEQFFEDRVADYAYASSINRELNDATVRYLAWASFCLLVGVVYLLGIVMYAIWRS